MFKVNGLDKATTKQQSRMPKPFRDTPEPVYSGIFGRTFDGEEELRELWDSGEIDNLAPSFPPPTKNVEEIKRNSVSANPESQAGLTEMEKMEQAYGYTPALKIALDKAMVSRGISQPTSKGPKYIESNVLQMRQKFGKV